MSTLLVHFQLHGSKIKYLVDAKRITFGTRTGTRRENKPMGLKIRDTTCTIHNGSVQHVRHVHTPSTQVGHPPWMGLCPYTPRGPWTQRRGPGRSTTVGTCASRLRGRALPPRSPQFRRSGTGGSRRVGTQDSGR